MRREQLQEAAERAVDLRGRLRGLQPAHEALGCRPEERVLKPARVARVKRVVGRTARRARAHTQGRAAGARVEAAIKSTELEQPIRTERRQLLLRQRLGSLVQQRGRHRDGCGGKRVCRRRAGRHSREQDGEGEGR